MAVIVSFMRPGGLGSIHAVGVGRVRVRESLSLNGTTTASAVEGEMALLCSTEEGVVLAAFGTTPDAAATAATGVTTAGFSVPPGTWVPVALPVGAKINVKAIA